MEGMRSIVLLLCLFPVMLSAQINRSASELARENIREYLTDKIFKSFPYQPLSYGELKPLKEKNTDVRWSMIHNFEVTENQIEDDKKVPVQKPYEFIFYLDDKLKVRRAKSYSD